MVVADWGLGAESDPTGPGVGVALHGLGGLGALQVGGGDQWSVLID